jgi:hypothetical protein
MGKFTPNQYPVRLTAEERERLERIVRNGHAPAKKILHARVLLLSDHHHAGGHWSEPRIAAALGIHRNSVSRIRKRFVLDGERPALERKPRETPPVPPKLDGRAEAHLVAICCGPPPEGRTRWTLGLLANELTRRGLVTQISAEAVRLKLKKTSCSLGGNNPGVCRSATRPGLSRNWKTCSTSTKRRTRQKSR